MNKVDGSYRQLLSNPALVRDLFVGIVSYPTIMGGGVVAGRRDVGGYVSLKLEHASTAGSRYIVFSTSSKTWAPATTSSGSAHSLSSWLIPSLQGMKIMALGQCPAR